MQQHNGWYWLLVAVAVVWIALDFIMLADWLLHEPPHLRLTCANAEGNQRVALHCDEGRP